VEFYKQSFVKGHKYHIFTKRPWNTYKLGTRTKGAVRQLKARSIILGKPENLTIEAIKKGCNIRMENARTHKANMQAKELPTLYRNMGMTYQGMAEKLNQSQYLTRRQKLFDGKGVYRLLERKNE